MVLDQAARMGMLVFCLSQLLPFVAGCLAYRFVSKRVQRAGGWWAVLPQAMWNLFQ